MTHVTYRLTAKNLYLYLLVFAYTVFTIHTNAMIQDANSELLPNQSRVLIFGSTATRS